MRFSTLLAASLLLLLDFSSACCCNWGASNCRCNIFGCNCDTADGGWCYKKFNSFAHHIPHLFEFKGCKSSKYLYWMYREHCELGSMDCSRCPLGRKKRSVIGDILEAGSYAGGLYDHLMERSAMKTFLNFDLNRDGRISREEANATVEQFKQVDEDNDGFVHPGELDMSLK